MLEYVLIYDIRSYSPKVRKDTKEDRPYRFENFSFSDPVHRIGSCSYPNTARSKFRQEAGPEFPPEEIEDESGDRSYFNRLSKGCGAGKYLCRRQAKRHLAIWW